MRTVFSSVVLLFVSLLASSASADIPAITDFRPVISAPGLSSVSSPVMNGNGDILFSAVDSTGQDGTYVYSAQTRSTTRLDFGQAKVRRPRDLNNSHTVPADGGDSSGEGLFVTSPGGAILTIRGNSLGQYSDPSILDAGTLCFTARDGNQKGQRGIYAASSSGQIITIFGGSSLATTVTGTLALSSSSGGLFAMVGADPNTGSLGIFAGTLNPGGALITLQGANFTGAGTLYLSSSRSSSHVAWSGTISLSGASSSVLCTSSFSGGSALTITGENFGQCSIDRNGDVLCDVTDPSSSERSLMAYSEDGAVHRPYLSIGDSFDGSTVTDFSISPNSLSDDGQQFTFAATLSDGRSGIYIADLPEPTIIAPLAAGILMIARRRPSKRQSSRRAA